MVSDVVVIGAGPAGLSAALCLLRRGFQVVVLGAHYGMQQALGMGVPPALLRTAQVEVRAPAGATRIVTWGARWLRGLSPGRSRPDGTATGSPVWR